MDFSHKRSVSILVLLLVLSTAILAACEVTPTGVVVEPDPVTGESEITELETVEQDEVAEPDAGDGAVARKDVMVLASAMLGREVEDPNRSRLGFLDDIVIDLNTGNILFVLIGDSDLLGLGDDQVPVPLAALVISPDLDELILNVREEQFANFPTLDIDDDWPLGLDAIWDDQLGEFWTAAGFDMSTLEGVDPGMTAHVDDLIGYGVGAFNTPGLANAGDFIIDLAQERVKYAVLIFVEGTAYSEDWLILPFNAFEPASFGDELVLDERIDDSTLASAPYLTDVNRLDTEFFEPAWDDTIQNFWREQGYELD